MAEIFRTVGRCVGSASKRESWEWSSAMNKSLPSSSGEEILEVAQVVQNIVALPISLVAKDSVNCSRNEATADCRTYASAKKFWKRQWAPSCEWNDSPTSVMWIFRFLKFGKRSLATIFCWAGEFGPEDTRATTDCRWFCGFLCTSTLGRDRRDGDFGPTRTGAPERLVFLLTF